MTQYLATICHHSISRAREIQINGTLTAAKRAATREFGDEQRDYVIAIHEDMGDSVPVLISTRRVSGRKWHDCP